jgi:AraC-like DNA-binding protein
MAGPTVAAGITKRLLEVAVERGASRRALIEASGVSPEELGDHDNRIALSKHMALVRAAKRLCADPAFALHYGNSVNLAEVSVVGLLGYACETVLDAFVQLQRYSRLIMDLDLGIEGRFELVRDDQGLWLVDRRPHPNDYPELTEGTFAQMMNGMRRFGNTPFVLAVEVTHADPGYASEYERIFKAPVAFESTRNALRIDPAWLSYRVAEQPRYVFGVLARHAEELLARLDTDAGARARLEEVILVILHTGRVAMPAVAQRLGCSRDTLYRRLKAEGLTFAGVLDDLRHRLAVAYVSGGKVSINETAYLVGFADPASFSRAFKRWTGKSPKAFRR